MKLFDVDGPLYRFLSRFWDVIKLNFLWLIFSLPVVTFGASTAAAFSVTLKMVDDQEGYIFRDFWKAFRENLKQGSLLGLLFLAALYSVYLDAQITAAALRYEGLFLAGTLIIAAVFGVPFVYAFALQARYENTIFRTLSNSRRLCFRYFLRTLLMVLICGVAVALFSWNRTLIFIGILVGPACIMLTVSGFAMYFFREIDRENKGE
jgi:uncharacterized membrane protein YesL